MFGDFITLCLDQLLQHASKFRMMFNNKVSVPLILRTPMGGKRGYGPTHSQCLEEHFLGIPDLHVLAINDRIDPRLLHRSIREQLTGPVLMIENKILYTKPLHTRKHEGFLVEASEDIFPTLRIRPQRAEPCVTLFCYGQNLEIAEQAARLAFEEAELWCEIIRPTLLHPFPAAHLIRSLQKTRRLVTIEEGSRFASLSAEAIAQSLEAGVHLEKVQRVSFDSVIPCSFSAEIASLPSASSVLRAILEIAK